MVGQTAGVLLLAALAFSIAWWLGLYLLARDPGKPVLRRAATGLTAYALALACDALGAQPAAWALLSVPALAWAGVVLALLPEDLPRRRAWERAWLGSAVASALAALALPGPARLVVLLPLAVATVALVRGGGRGRPRPPVGLLVVAALLFGLGLAALLVAAGMVPRWPVLAAIGLDLAVLGVVVARFDAFTEGEAFAGDMRRSASAAGAAALLFGGQVAAALALSDPAHRPLRWLLFAVLASAIAVAVLANPLQALLDRLAFPKAERLRRERADLREAAEALGRRADDGLATMDEVEFARLTRRALSNYGDLGKLVSSPLVNLPQIDLRLAERGAPDQPLERAAELKALLLESIVRLKPRDGEFGTSEEWRYYNALYFYYVAGVRPYRRGGRPTGLDPVARRAYDWFAREVPERTLHNWQNAAARLVAADLRNWQ